MGQTPTLTLPLGEGTELLSPCGRVEIFDFGEGSNDKTVALFKEKVAFTLAEVLITLGIIGVVAAMTLPNLIGNYKKAQTVTHLKKVYTTLNQALKLSEAKYGPYEYWESGINNDDIVQTDAIAYYEKYWFPHFKVIKICNTRSECGYKSNQPWSNMDGSRAATVFTAQNTRVPFVIADGTLISISLTQGDSSSPTGMSSHTLIFVDLNGHKPPNTFGKDVFVFVRTPKKGILPNGYHSTVQSVNSSCNSNGWSCTAKIMQDGWEIKDDYPW